jgi:hypothetical protein
VLVARSDRTSTFLENWRTARRVPLLPARLHLNAHFGERFAVRFAVRFKVRFAVSLAGLDKARRSVSGGSSLLNDLRGLEMNGQFHNFMDSDDYDLLLNLIGPN